MVLEGSFDPPLLSATVLEITDFHWTSDKMRGGGTLGRIALYRYRTISKLSQVIGNIFADIDRLPQLTSL